MDRGYFGNELVTNLANLNVNFIFRLSINYNFVKTFIKSKSKDETINYDINGDNEKIKLRIIEYEIDNNKYYIGTNLLDKNKYDIDYLKNIYWKRWQIEVDFRHSKYDLSLKELKSKNINKIKQDIASHNLLLLIDGYIENIFRKKIKNKHKINKKNSLDQIVDRILYIFFYKKLTKKIMNKIIHILNIIKDTIVAIRKNRKFKRIRKKPTSKWCCYGNQFIKKRHN